MFSDNKLSLNRRYGKIHSKSDLRLRPVSNVAFRMCRIQLLELCACKIRRLKRLNATFLIAVDLNFKFDPTGRIMRAKCELNATSVFQTSHFACVEFNSARVGLAEKVWNEVKEGRHVVLMDQISRVGHRMVIIPCFFCVCLCEK